MIARLALSIALGACALAVALPAQDRGGRGGDETPPAGDAGRKKPDEDLSASYFKMADYDADGWIVYSEARKSMQLDKPAFGNYDTDNDGRISPEEFAHRYRSTIARGGAFQPPNAKVDPKKSVRRSPQELLDTFDRDKDLALDGQEVLRALQEYGARDIAPRTIVESLDKDRSNKLEKDEMPGLLDVLSPTSEPRTSKKSKSIEDLFDKIEQREVEKDSTREPPRIVGPVSTFRRLDFDSSGGISLDDLVELQRPIQMSVRTSAVVATLDLDGNGAISLEEFRASMR